jgi:hypothetical protein
LRRRLRCSTTPPWRASTPIVRVLVMFEWVGRDMVLVGDVAM